MVETGGGKDVSKMEHIPKCSDEACVGECKKEVRDERKRPESKEHDPSKKMEEVNRRRGAMNAKHREQMMSDQKSMKELAKKIHEEEDSVKKEEMIEQLRTQLTAGSEKMQESFRKRLETAEGEVEKMKQRLVDIEKGKEKKVEELLQRLILDAELKGQRDQTRATPSK